MFKKEDLLNKAIVSGNFSEAERLLKQNANADHLLGMRGTALCAALSANQTDIASLLIDSGCSVNVEDFDQETPLFLALRKECFEIAKKLIMHPKCKLDQKDKITGLSPFCYAAMMGYSEIVQMMIKSGCNIKATDADGNTALHLAVERRRLKEVQFLASRTELLQSMNTRGLTPLHLACNSTTVSDSYSIVLMLLRNSLYVDPLTQNTSGIVVPPGVKDQLCKFVNTKTKYENVTPLFLAIQKDKIKLAHLLLECGANPNIRSLQVRNAGTCLMQACVRYLTGLCVDNSIIDLLLKSGSDPLQEDFPGLTGYAYNLTPLHFAIEHGSLEILKLMVPYIDNEKAICIHPPPLRTALARGKFDIAWFFMVDMRQFYFEQLVDQKHQILHWIRENRMMPESENEKNMDSIVKHLLSCDIDIDGDLDQNTGNCTTPLQYAIKHQYKTKVKVLLSNGADARICDSEFVTAAGLCVQSRDLDMLKWVIWTGINVDDVIDDTKSPLYLSLENDLNLMESLEIVWFLLDGGSKVSQSCLEAYENNEFVDELSSDDDSEMSETDDEDYELTEKKENAYSNGILGETGQPPLKAPEHGDRNLLQTLRHYANEFPSLRMMCVRCIRQQFQDNRKSFDHVTELGLPKSVAKFIAYNM